MDAFSGPGTNQDKPACFQQEAAPELQMSFPFAPGQQLTFSLLTQPESAQSLPSSSPDSQNSL